MKIFKWIIFALAVATNVFIIVNACINGTISAQESGGFSHFLADIINFFSKDYINESNFDQFQSVIRKLIGHFALFGLDGVLSTLSVYTFVKDSKLKSPFWIVGITLGFGFLVACISEFIQIFTPDRFGSILDILIDFGGYSIGGAIVFIVLICTNSVVFTRKVE